MNDSIRKSDETKRGLRSQCSGEWVSGGFYQISTLKNLLLVSIMLLAQSSMSTLHMLARASRQGRADRGWKPKPRWSLAHAQGTQPPDCYARYQPAVTNPNAGTALFVILVFFSRQGFKLNLLLLTRVLHVLVGGDRQLAVGPEPA